MPLPLRNCLPWAEGRPKEFFSAPRSTRAEPVPEAQRSASPVPGTAGSPEAWPVWRPWFSCTSTRCTVNCRARVGAIPTYSAYCILKASWGEHKTWHQDSLTTSSASFKALFNVARCSSRKHYAIKIFENAYRGIHDQQGHKTINFFFFKASKAIHGSFKVVFMEKKNN